jgi:hypothetical protein
MVSWLVARFSRISDKLLGAVFDPTGSSGDRKSWTCASFWPIWLEAELLRVRESSNGFFAKDDHGRIKTSTAGTELISFILSQRFYLKKTRVC